LSAAIGFDQFTHFPGDALERPTTGRSVTRFPRLAAKNILRTPDRKEAVGMRSNFAESQTYRIAVLSGGDSDERAISLESGRCVAEALRERGHEVTLMDPAAAPPEAALFRDVDAAFLALHGRNGEDGTIQGLLDRMGVIFTGSGAEASRLAFSKSASKERFFQTGVPTPAYVLVHESDGVQRCRELADRIGFPLVVKPDSQGSSLGVTIVHSVDLLPQALSHCFRYDSFALFEQAVTGTEWTLPLCDDEPLPLIQISTPREFFDFTAKYEDPATQYRFEFAESRAAISSLVDAGCRAARAIGTKGLARVDLRLDHEGRPWVLEVNTIPGFTDHSLLPKAAVHAGLGLGELYERCLERSLIAACSRRSILQGPHRLPAWRAASKRA
jgi:D-alanine-D-alanine ligase